MQILLSLMKGIQVPVILLFQIVVIQCDIFIGGGKDHRINAVALIQVPWFQSGYLKRFPP